MVSEETERLKGGGARPVVKVDCSLVAEVAKLSSSSNSSVMSSGIRTVGRPSWMGESGRLSSQRNRRRESGEMSLEREPLPGVADRTRRSRSSFSASGASVVESCSSRADLLKKRFHDG